MFRVSKKQEFWDFKQNARIVKRKKQELLHF